MKLMRRSNGFITMHASLASGQVNVCVIPEMSILDLISLAIFTDILCTLANYRNYSCYIIVWLNGMYYEFLFTLDGPNGVLLHLEHLIRIKGAAVV